MELLSIIIPVYNMVPYLELCLESILAQDFEDFEVLMIDDGSTDRSAEICRSYADKDARFRLIQQVNAGVSQARNTGLQEAKGDWIMFIDADDVLLDCHGLTVLTDLAKTGKYDCIRGNYKAIDEVGNILWDETKRNLSREPFHLKELSQAEYLTEIVQDDFFGWLHIAKREMYHPEYSYFRLGMRFSEDKHQILRMIPFGKSFVYVSLPFYGYRKRETSVSYKEMSEKKIEDLMLIVKDVDGFSANQKCAKDLREAYRKVAVRSYEVLLSNLSSFNKEKRRKIVIKYDLENMRKSLISHGSYGLSVLSVNPLLAVTLLECKYRVKHFLYQIYIQIKR